MLEFRRKNSNIFIGKYMEFTFLAMLFLNETFYGIFKHCGLFTSVIGLYLKKCPGCPFPEMYWSHKEQNVLSLCKKASLSILMHLFQRTLQRIIVSTSKIWTEAGLALMSPFFDKTCSEKDLSIKGLRDENIIKNVASSKRSRTNQSKRIGSWQYQLLCG